jgi:hypothetical protein
MSQIKDSILLIRDKRIELEKSILYLLLAYEEETGVHIESIDLDRRDLSTCETKLSKKIVKVEITIKL